jgi:chitin disaccharide deacetylase
MIIINADDWGRSREETDAALSCHRESRITSVSAMVFMEDSERAAKLAKGTRLDVGLHLNLSQRYNGLVGSARVTDAQERIVRFMTRSKYSVLFYHPFLRRHFCDVYQDQMDEFLRLYGKPPSHVDGHQHKHLCANMLIDRVIPRGQRVRRNFSFWPGEKGLVNRGYRSVVDKWLNRRYRITAFFFSLAQCLKTKRLMRVAQLAKVADVELMTHPVDTDENAWLMSDAYLTLIGDLQSGTYALL